MTFEEAKAELDKIKEDIDEDDEGYHALYDSLLEARLEELDPDFMRKMEELYDESGMGRWYA